MWTNVYALLLYSHRKGYEDTDLEQSYKEQKQDGHQQAKKSAQLSPEPLVLDFHSSDPGDTKFLLFQPSQLQHRGGTEIYQAKSHPNVFSNLSIIYIPFEINP